jgi:2-dehydropantoate 2-reductase
VTSFVILGTGAIGSYIGGRLVVSGATVSFVGRKHSLDALASQGLLITDLDGLNQHIRPEALHLWQSLAQMGAEASRKASEESAVILVCVKGGATETVAHDIQQFCRPGSTVVSLQNGVENVARLRKYAPGMRVLAGMVPYNVVLKSPSHAHRATSGTLLIEQDAASLALAPILTGAGLDTELRSDMLEVQWGKLLLNLNNPINALSNLPLKPQLEDRNYRRVLAILQLEALDILAAAGIQPAQVGKAPPRLLPKILKLPNWLFKRAAASMLKMDASARSSMSADLFSGRPTETDDLCGAVARLAASLGKAAPANSAMLTLIKNYQPDQQWSGAKLLAAVSSS